MPIAMKKVLCSVMLALILLALLSMLISAASGPSVTKTERKEERPSPKPGQVTAEEAATFKCSAIDSMIERVKCRLQLPEENEYDYLPEECRLVVNESRGKCVSNYKKSQKCWASLKDSERFECARKAFGLAGTVTAQKSACDEMTGQNRSDCILQLTDKVDAVVKFRMYNLEEKAQRLMEKELVGIDTVTEFVAAIEQQKQNYNDAKTINEKKSVVAGVQKIWQNFIAKPKGKARGQGQ